MVCLSLTEEGEGRRCPEEAHECLHAVAECEQRADQVRESWNLSHRNLQESRGNVETDRQKPQRGVYDE